MPRVSVIIPTYNREKLVREAIQSVLRQTYTDFELIVVDDGSTDNTKVVVDRFNDPRISYVYQENRGVSAARNTGINISQAEYIAFLDSDDLYLEAALEKSVNSLESHKQVGFSYGQCYVMREDGETVYRIRKSPFHNYSTVINSIEQVRELLSDAVITTSTLTARRSCLEKINGFNEDLWFAEDYHFFIRLAKRYPSFYIAEPLIFRRLHRNQLSGSLKPGKEKAFLLILEEVFNDPDISPHCADLKGKAHSYFYSSWMAGSVYRSNKKLARRYLRKSIRFYPKVIFRRQIRHILYLYLLSLLPERMRLGIRDFKRRLQYILKRNNTS
jgi:glycosyltransferase involved in cell wall biosynthesis